MLAENADRVNLIVLFYEISNDGRCKKVVWTAILFRAVARRNKRKSNNSYDWRYTAKF